MSNTGNEQTKNHAHSYSTPSTPTAKASPSLVANFGLPPSELLKLEVSQERVQATSSESNSSEKQFSQKALTRKRIGQTKPPEPGILTIFLRVIASLAVLAVLVVGVILGVEIVQQVVNNQIVQLLVQADTVEERFDDLRQRLEDNGNIFLPPEEPELISEEMLGNNDALLRWVETRVNYWEMEIGRLENQLTLQPTTMESWYSPKVGLLAIISDAISTSDQADQQLTDLRERLLHLDWRIYRLEQHLETQYPPQAPGSIEVFIDSQDLPADGQASMPIRMQLLDASGQPNPISQSISVSLAEGDGELEYAGYQDRQIDLMTNELGKAIVTYHAGFEPGRVVVNVRSGEMEEGSVAFNLNALTPHSLEASLSPDVLQARSGEHAALTIQVFSENGQLLPGATEVNLIATPDSVVIVDPPSPLIAQDGVATTVVQAVEGLREAFDVTFDITAEGTSEQVVLHLEPPPMPICKVTDSIEVFTTQEIDENNTGKAFDLPLDIELGCPTGLSETPAPVVVTFWMPAELVVGGVLSHTEAIEVSLHPQSPLEDPQVALWSFSKGASVQRTEQEEVDGQIQVRLQGWAMPPSSLELIEEP